MKFPAALVFAALFGWITFVALLRSKALGPRSGGKTFVTRKEQPFFYWLSVGVTALGSAVCVAMAFF